MEFRVLGLIEVLADSGPVPVRAGLERSLLALLVLEAGRLVTYERIVDVLWKGPPGSAKAQVHNMISRLRRTGGGVLGSLLVRHGSGYRLELDGHGLDLAEFRGLATEGRAATEPERAIALLTGALECWRGPALADAVPALVETVGPALEDERLRVTEALLGAELAAGRYDAALHRVTGLLAAHPYREDLHRRRLLALAGLGRRAAALEAYQQVRRRLVDELGIEPGAGLRELHQRLLDDTLDRELNAEQDAGLGAGAASGEQGAVAPGRGGAWVVARQLPAAEEVLSGRDGLLASMHEALTGRRLGPSVVVLTGTGGVGKSALAVHAAQLHVDGFPDGQLYADLHGTHEAALDPGEVLGRFLRAVGVPGREIAPDLDERAAQYRSVLAGRQVLLVLDDARDEAQVRPLLPGGAGSAVVITSRRRLDALPVAVTHQVPTLAPESAVALLSRTAGLVATTPVDHAAAVEVAGLCGHLPLAIRIAGARLAARPDWTLDGLRDRLVRARLDELVVGDLDVRASIALSYRSLEPGAASAFRRLGLLGPLSFPSWLPGVLSDGDDLDPLGSLLDRNLVQAVGVDEAGQARFRLHDLVREFAREAALAEDPAPVRDAAMGRVLDGWLALTVTADPLLGHGGRRLPDVSTVEAPEPAGGIARTRPLNWFEAERASLLAAVRAAVDGGHLLLASDLALHVKGFLTMRSYGQDGEATQRALVRALRQSGRRDRGYSTRGHGARLLRHLRALFWACAEQDRNDELPAIIAEITEVADALGDTSAQLDAAWQYAQVLGRTGRLVEAERVHRDGVANELRLSGSSERVHAAYVGLALTQAELGDADAAVLNHRRAAAVGEPAGRKRAIVLCGYGEALVDAGQLDEAERVAGQAAGVVAEIDDVLGAAHVRILRAHLDIARGRWAAALDRLVRALDVVRAHHEPHGISLALRRLGEVAIARGDASGARAALDEALVLAGRMSRPVDEARVLARLAVVSDLAGDHAAAAGHRDRCRRILEELDLPATSLRLPAHLAHHGVHAMTGG